MRASRQKSLVEGSFDPFKNMKQALVTRSPWDSIIDFASHPSFCNLKLYPRQMTLLKLIFLETENMTDYDVGVISRWAESFKDPSAPQGVQPDIWERVDYLKRNGYRRFPHIQLVMGRRASKGVMGGIIGAEQLAYFYSLDDWQDHYGLPQGKEGYLMTLATSQTQAKRFQFADIRQTVEGCKYLQPAISTSREEGLTIRTPSDLRTISRMHQDGIPIEREIASLRVVPMSSNSASGRGAATFGNIYDEMAHMIAGTGSVKSSEEIYSSYQPALDQFGKDSLTLVPSSPWSKVGQFYELYRSGCVTLDEYNQKHDKQIPILDEEDRELNAEEGLDRAVADPEMLVVQLSSWDLYLDFEHSEHLGGPHLKRAIQYSPKGDAPENQRMARLEAKNPDRFKVERRAQFAEVLDAYLNPRKIDAMFEPFWGGKILEAQSKGRLDRTYRIHIDPATTNANFALAIAHLEDSPEPDEHGEYWPHVVIDYLHVWKAKDFPDHTIDYTMVYKDLVDVLKRFPTTAKFSSDAWNSAAFLAMLRRDFGQRIKFEESNFSDKGNRERAEYFKSALNLGWVHSYSDDLYEGSEGSLLELELKFLSEKKGKVERQTFGPVTTKDLADCYDSETEVFTENGWKLFKDVSMSEKVGTVNSIGEFELQYPTDRIDKQYVGKMLEGISSFNGYNLNFKVTPGHRMLSKTYADRSNGWSYSLAKAEETFSKKVKIPTTPVATKFGSIDDTNLAEVLPESLPNREPLPGECLCGCGDEVSGFYSKGHGNRKSAWTEDQVQFLVDNYPTASMGTLMHVCNKTKWPIYNKAQELGLVRGQIGDRVSDRPALLPSCRMVDFARFVGFWIGDGYKSRPGFDVVISVVKERKKDYLYKLLDSMGWGYSTSDRGNGEVSFIVKSYELREYLKKLTITGSHDLRLPEEAFSEWDLEERRGLIEGLLESDGCNGESYSGTSKLLLEDMQRLLLTVGVGSKLHKDKSADSHGQWKDLYVLRLFKKNYVGVTPDKVREVDYEGTVHCLTVPNSTLITRRGGQTLVAGNCVMEVSVDLLREHLDHWERALLGISGAYGSTDVPAIRNDRVPPLESFSRPLSSFQGKGPLGGGSRRKGGSVRNPMRGRW